MPVETTQTDELFTRFPDRIVVKAAAELHQFRRNGRILVVEPETASWMVMEPPQYRLVEALGHSPMFLDECCNILGPDPAQGKEFIGRLYLNQIVSFNHRFHYNPSIMWKDGPKLPHFFVVRTTNQCNYGCRYCYAGTGSQGEHMSARTMKMIIERVMAELPCPVPVFEFHGGEPLLNLPTILEAMEYGYSLVDKYQKNLQFLLQTNGSLLSEDVFKALDTYNVGIGVSLDGNEEIHNRNRVYHDGRGTYQDTMRGLNAARYYGNGTGVLCSIHRGEDYLPAFESMLEQGYDSFAIRSIFPGGRALEGLEFPEERNAIMAQGCLKVFEHLIRLNRRSGSKISVREVNFILYNITHKSRVNMCMRSPCGAGTSIASFNPHGDIFPCDDFTDMMEFRMGHITDNRPLPLMITESRAYKTLQSRAVEAIPRCRRCAWRHICCASCPVSAYTVHQTVMREDFLCGFFRRVIPEFIWRVAEDPQIISDFSEDGEVSLPDLKISFYHEKKARPKRKNPPPDQADVSGRRQRIPVPGGEVSSNQKRR